MKIILSFLLFGVRYLWLPDAGFQGELKIMPPNSEICLVATAEPRVFDAKLIRGIISSDYPRSETMCPLASHFMLKFRGSRSMHGCHFHVTVASSGEMSCIPERTAEFGFVWKLCEFNNSHYNAAITIAIRASQLHCISAIVQNDVKMSW